jgi:hypothetical protein
VGNLLRKNTLTVGIGTAICKMQVHQFVKRIPLHTAVFMTTRYEKIRIARCAVAVLRVKFVTTHGQRLSTAETGL